MAPVPAHRPGRHGNSFPVAGSVGSILRNTGMKVDFLLEWNRMRMQMQQGGILGGSKAIANATQVVFRSAAAVDEFWLCQGGDRWFARIWWHCLLGTVRYGDGNGCVRQFGY